MRRAGAGPWWASRVAALGAAAAALAGATVLACASPVPIDWTDVDRARRASDAVAAEIHRMGAERAPVRIEAGGLVGFGSLSASVAYRLWSGGSPVYFSSLWPYPQDDDFRAVGAAPPDATRVLISESNPAAPAALPESMPADALVLTMAVDASTTIRIYVDEPAPPA